MVVRAADKHPQEVAPGIIRSVLSHGAHLMLVEFSLKKGARVEAHSHPHEQITYVVRGTLFLNIDERTVVLAAGETCLIPSGSVHAAEAFSECLVVDTFSPPREDFLQ